MLKSVWLRRFAAAWLGILASIALVNAPANAVVEWHGGQSPPLSTPWTHLVGPNNALPEYPRPQMTRTRWLNLNGVWEYTGRSGQAALAAPPPANEYRERILVPYPTESALSGIQRHDDQMWYRKVFKLPSTWRRAARAAALRRGRPNRHRLGEQPTGGPPRRRVHGVQRGHHRCAAAGIAATVDRAGRGPQRDQPFPVGKQRNRRRGCSTRDRRASGRRCGWSRCAPRTSTSSTSPRT